MTDNQNLFDKFMLSATRNNFIDLTGKVKDLLCYLLPVRIMEKAFEIQKSARDSVKTLQTYMTDLQNWEAEMKRKEAALNGEFEQV